APVASITRAPFVMEVHPSVPAKTVPEFIAYAKANPGKINMASSGNGTVPHLSGELFKIDRCRHGARAVSRLRHSGNSVTNSKKDATGVPRVAQTTLVRINPDRFATLSLCRAANAVEQAAAEQDQKRHLDPTPVGCASPLATNPARRYWREA